MDVRFIVAGRMELWRGTSAIRDDAFGGRQQRLAGAMLLLERHRPLAVDVLAEELWPHRRPPSWRSGLRNAVAGVRSLLVAVGLGAETLQHQAGQYVVDLPGLQVDIEVARRGVEDAERLLARGDVHRACRVAQDAVAVLGRPVLGGLESDWLERVRDGLGTHLVDSLLVLASCETDRRDWESARDAATRAIELAPLREECWRRLMQVEAAAGNTAAAVAVYERCRRQLVDDLGTDPDEQTQQLHADLLRAAPRSGTISSSWTARPGRASVAHPEFIGRDALLDRVGGLLAEGGNVLLRGSAGVGKTRLAAELLTTDVLDGRATDRVMASSGLADVQLGTLGPLAVEMGVSRAEPSELIGWFLRRWRGAQRAEPAILWLDDAQHTDALSAAIVRHAVTTEAVQLVATWRRPAPLVDDLAALVTEGLVTTVDVPPLDDVAARQLARSLVSGSLHETPPLRRLVELAAGNPLYMRELARVWRLEGDVRLDGVEVLVARPLARLSTSRRRTAELIAIAEPVPAALLSSRGDDLGVLMRSGVVQRHGRNSLRIDHPLRAAWLREQLEPASGSAYRELADLARDAGLEEHLDPLTLVGWQLRGSVQPDPERLLTATRSALVRADVDMATTLADRVVGPERDLLRGEARLLAGRREQGLRLLERVRVDGRDVVAAEATLWLVRERMIELDHDAAYDLLEAAEDGPWTPDARRRLLLGWLWLWTFGPIRPHDRVERVIDEVRTLEPVPEAHELFTMALAVGYQRLDPWDLVDLVRSVEAIEATDQVDLPRRSRACTVTTGFWFIAGEVDRALATLTEHLPEVLDRRLPESTAILTGVGAFVLGLAGRIDEAVQLGSSAPSRSSPADWFRQTQLARLTVLGNLCYQGRVDEVRPAIHDHARHVSSLFFIEPLLGARACTLATEAATSVPCNHCLREAQQQLLAQGKFGWGSVMAAETTDRRTDPDVLRDVLAAVRMVDGRGLAATVGDATMARLERRPGGVMAAGRRFEEGGFVPAALRAFADVLAWTEPGTELSHDAGRALVRMLRRWDGIQPWWIDDRPTVPSLALVRRAWPTDPGADPVDVAEARGELRAMLSIDDDSSFDAAFASRGRPGPSATGA